MFLSDYSWSKAEEYFTHSDIALIPVGALENHGTHLPLGTDCIVPQHLAGMIEKRREILITPAIPYGVSDHHSAFPGTVSIGYDGLLAVVSSIVKSLWHWGIRRFIFLNGHGGNSPVLSRVSLEISQQGGIACAVNWWQLSGELDAKWKGGHAGGQETAAILAISPEKVHMEDVVEYTPRKLTDKLKLVSLGRVELGGAGVEMIGDVRRITGAGWFGNDHPTTATREWGEEMLEATASFCCELIDEFKKIELN